ncbi:MAG: hypothetical protein PVI65_13230, partial [Desulfobacterales bacterium]
KIIADPQITAEYRKVKSDKCADFFEKVETVLSFQIDTRYRSGLVEIRDEKNSPQRQTTAPRDGQTRAAR